MPTMAEPTPGAVEVQIFGASYHVRGGGEADHLVELAAQVDRRMRELAGHAPNAEAGKLAILVALNLADELAKQQESQLGERGDIESRVVELTERLAGALKS